MSAKTTAKPKDQPALTLETWPIERLTANEFEWHRPTAKVKVVYYGLVIVRHPVPGAS